MIIEIGTNLMITLIAAIFCGMLALMAWAMHHHD
jgi:hypothetical protein